jgi:hypothetical protein
VKRRERLVPYVLLAVLILGAGLGMGLGLSEAPTPPIASLKPGCTSVSPSIGVSYYCVLPLSLAPGTSTSAFPLARPGTARPAVVAIPNVIGDSLSTAEAQLSQLGFGANIAQSVGTAPVGTVTSEAPIPGAGQLTGSTVNLGVSAGSHHPVPRFVSPSGSK